MVQSVKIFSVRNCKYITPEGDVDLEINHPEYGWIPYTLALADPCNYINNDELMALALEKGIEPLDPVEWEEKQAAIQRMNRHLLLSQVDDVARNPLRWDKLSIERKEEINDYREALLDITKQDTFPEFVEWPEAPEGVEQW